MITFRDTNRSFELDGDLWETMTNYDFNVDHSNPQDRNTIFEFGKEMKFNIERTKKVIEIKLLKNTQVINFIGFW